MASIFISLLCLSFSLYHAAQAVNGVGAKLPTGPTDADAHDPQSWDSLQSVLFQDVGPKLGNPGYKGLNFLK